MTPQDHTECLAQLLAAAAASNQAFLCALPDGLHLKVALRGERPMVCAWADGGRLSPQRLEEIGEDAGFYDPLVRPWQCAESASAHLIVEGFRGELCAHDFGMLMHFDAKNEFGNMGHCQRCWVFVSRSLSRRGSRESCTYDTWELRPHVWQRWVKRGPVPGSLQPQAHHRGATG